MIKVIIFQCLFGIRGLEKMTGKMAGAEGESGEEGGGKMKFMSVLTDPLVKSIIKVSKSIWLNR